jgi:hypothetical protein
MTLEFEKLRVRSAGEVASLGNSCIDIQVT